MTKLQGWGVGVVYKAAEIITGSGGKTGIELIVRFEDRTLDDGRKFHQRVLVRSFVRGVESIARQLRVGTVVVVSGEVDAKAEDVNGVTFANPRIIGRVELFETSRHT